MKEQLRLMRNKIEGIMDELDDLIDRLDYQVLDDGTMVVPDESALCADPVCPHNSHTAPMKSRDGEWYCPNHY